MGKEIEPTPELAEEADIPSIEEMIEACRGIIPDEDLDFLSQRDWDDVFGSLLTYLPEYGVEDPEAFLLEKGFAEEYEIGPPLPDITKTSESGDT